jgi:hypothetical protein
MCWKQEWAMAINNLEHAVGHIQRARVKLEKRLERNKKCLEKLKDNPRFRNRFGQPYEKILAPTEKKIAHNSAGIEECTRLIETLKTSQDHLFRMIHKYGIKHSEDPQRVYQLMGKWAIQHAHEVVITKEAKS